MVLFAPAPLFSAFIGVLTAWGLYEVAEMTKSRDAVGIGALAIAGGGSAALVSYTPQTLWFIPLAAVVVMLTLVGRVGSGAVSAARAGLGLTVLGAFYVGALFPYFALVRNQADGISTLIFVLLLVMASDTGAYFTGIWLGRTKLAPRVSPNKTVEGAIGGLAACVIAGLVLRAPLAAQLSVGQSALIAAAIGILAQLGDLAGSALKRSAGVKDSGWIMPGHGGLLDRTCSMVFANFLVYYCMR
jgi:phosphatidate cytidylyltransferase